MPSSFLRVIESRLFRRECDSNNLERHFGNSSEGCTKRNTYDREVSQDWTLHNSEDSSEISDYSCCRESPKKKITSRIRKGYLRNFWKKVFLTPLRREIRPRSTMDRASPLVRIRLVVQVHPRAYLTSQLLNFLRTKNPNHQYLVI